MDTVSSENDFRSRKRLKSDKLSPMKANIETNGTCVIGSGEGGEVTPMSTSSDPDLPLSSVSPRCSKIRKISFYKLKQNGAEYGFESDKNDKVKRESSKSPITANNNINSNGPILSGNYSVPTTITKRSVTLPMLLAAGILKPGEGNMSLEYHGQKFLGDLLANGQINSQETSQIFSSPSAWAIACKQIINPDKILRKSGCGWASIKYRGLKLDYYKTVWFKRLREGSIDLKQFRLFSNGTSSSSEDTDDDDVHCVLKFGEHFDHSPSHQSALNLGAKVLISCTEFREIDRLQPFHVKFSAAALAIADFHCNLTNTECIGYISGNWNSELNCLRAEMIHPCKILISPEQSHSSSTSSPEIDKEIDIERNRVAGEIKELGKEVVGWYHSHPKAPPYPSKDDVTKQLEYQVMMKGSSELQYIPVIGLIISPHCYSGREEGNKFSNIQLFWVLPPPENRPLEMGRPMHIDFQKVTQTNQDTKNFLLNMDSILEYYKNQKDEVDLIDLAAGRFEKLKETISYWLPEVKDDEEFWKEVKEIITKPSQPLPLKPTLISKPPQTAAAPAVEKRPPTPPVNPSAVPEIKENLLPELPPTPTVEKIEEQSTTLPVLPLPPPPQETPPSPLSLFSSVPLLKLESESEIIEPKQPPPPIQLPIQIPVPDPDLSITSLVEPLVSNDITITKCEAPITSAFGGLGLSLGVGNIIEKIEKSSSSSLAERESNTLSSSSSSSNSSSLLILPIDQDSLKDISASSSPSDLSFSKNSNSINEKNNNNKKKTK